MSTVFLGLGSNLGNREGNLEKACYLIEKEIGIIQKKSSIYKTAAWGEETQEDFYNQVIRVETTLEPLDLLEKCKGIEQELGRIPNEKWGPRLIDIDILFYNTIVFETPTLTIPHRYLAERKFVLIPMSEIANELQHPVFQKNIKTLLSDCLDKLPVQILIK